MTFDEFRERIRIAVVAGAFDAKKTTAHLAACGWATTRDVPADQRAAVLERLEKINEN
jgi:hypothetical protein